MARAMRGELEEAGDGALPGQTTGRMASMTDERIVPMRLQRFLARAGVASRRGSENLMTAGRVTVNGHVVTELGSKVDPLRRGRGRRQGGASGGRPCYLMLNKPRATSHHHERPLGQALRGELVPTEALSWPVPGRKARHRYDGPSAVHHQRRSCASFAAPVDACVEALCGPCARRPHGERSSTGCARAST